MVACLEINDLSQLLKSGAANEVVRKIANYAFSHNVQELTFTRLFSRHNKEYPELLFSSQSLKHLTLTYNYRIRFTETKPLDFPALTTLNLSYMELWSDIFSNCVNLKNLTLENFYVKDGGVFGINTPCLSNLTLIKSHGVKVLNLIAPQLENLTTVVRCYIKNLNAPTGLSTFRFTLYLLCNSLLQFSNDRFHSLQKVTLCLSKDSTTSYKEEDARKIINLLQALQCVRYLTLSADTLEVSQGSK